MALVGAFLINTVAIYVGVMDGRRVPPDEHVMRGKMLWQGNNCQACHQLFGLGGYMGPDLTNEARTKDAAYIATFIRYGTGRMPAHPLTDAEIGDLVAYLTWVDRHGTSIVPADAVHWSGTYMIPTDR